MGLSFNEHKKKHHHKHPESLVQWEGDGNGGSYSPNQPGFESTDYWWHQDNDAKNGYVKHTFDELAAHPWYPLVARSEKDTEPQGHATGFSFVQQAPMSNAQWWHDGNAGSTEKWDAFEEQARFSNSQDEFHNKARQPWIGSLNGGDGEPIGHPMGSTAQLGSKWWHDGIGGSTEKWDAFEEQARFSNSQDEFHTKARQPWIGSLNGGDAEPAGHPMGSTAQKSSGWWHDGNGGGGENWDAIEEQARFSNSQDEFHAKMK